jgi:hypothetical protein
MGSILISNQNNSCKKSHSMDVVGFLRVVRYPSTENVMN